MHSTYTVIESQIDWLTGSQHHKDEVPSLRALAERLAIRERENGERPGHFRMMGYLGWRCGRVRYGEREGAGLIQLSGDLAAQHFDEVWRLVDTWTRVDVACTVRYDPPRRDEGVTTYRDAVDYFDSHPHSARPWHVADADGGWTTYLGERASAEFVRIYNKEAEAQASGDAAAIGRYAACWRYEAEYKGNSAPAVVADLHRDRDRPGYCQARLFEYLKRHGIVPGFDADGNRVLSPGFRRRSDRDTRVAWLRRSVKPALEQLLFERSYHDVLVDLGLPNYCNHHNTRLAPDDSIVCADCGAVLHVIDG